MNAAGAMHDAYTSEELPENTRKGLHYSRAAGVATGLFLIAWVPFNAWRWQGQAPAGLLEFEAVYFVIFGLILALPWGKIARGNAWRPLFILLCVLTVGFGFLMVVDLMFQYILASGEMEGVQGASLYNLESGKGPSRVAPPAFQSMIVFISFLQAPTIYFLRHPRALS